MQDWNTRELPRPAVLPRSAALRLEGRGLFGGRRVCRLQSLVGHGGARRNRRTRQPREGAILENVFKARSGKISVALETKSALRVLRRGQRLELLVVDGPHLLEYACAPRRLFDSLGADWAVLNRDPVKGAIRRLGKYEVSGLDKIRRNGNVVPATDSVCRDLSREKGLHCRLQWAAALWSRG